MSVKLLESRDDNFDVCRSFLVVSMVVTHVFEMFYLPDYNRHLTYYVTIGFVFISGFTVGALYSERIRNDPQKYMKKLMGRAYKLFIIFVICNSIIVLSIKTKFDAFIQLSIIDVIMSIFLGTNQALFGFDILVPIALTSFFSTFLLKARDSHLNLAFMLFFPLSVWGSEVANVLNYYGIKLLFIGLIGCLTGNLACNLDWDRTLKKLSNNSITTISGIAVLFYYTALIFFTTKSTPITVYYQVIPTIIMLFFVYMLSYDFRLSESLLIKIPNKVLAKYMLFAYLFHILVINLLFLVIEKDSLDFFGTSILALFVLSFTIATCHFVDFLNLKSPVLAKIYSRIFKL